MMKFYHLNQTRPEPTATVTIHTENKKDISKALFPVLQLTRAGESIENLSYTKLPTGEEHAFILYGNGYTRNINISADCSVSLFRDIIPCIQ